MIVYDDSKEQDILNDPYNYQALEGFVINNWRPTHEVVRVLKDLGVKVYYKINVFDKTGKEFTDEIDSAYLTGIDGIAVDGEAYSHATIWQNNTQSDSERLGRNIRSYILFRGLETLLMPEYLGGEKYKTYESFIYGLNPEKILMERTYNEWKPWEIKRFWERNKKYPGRKYIGVWQDMFPWYAFVCRWIQLLTVKILTKDIFWYTEVKYKRG